MPTQNPPSREYKVKAAFLFNFTKFVDWPSASFINAEAPFVIAVVGIDPFGPLIDETVSGEKVKGHVIVIRRYSLLKDIEHCHMLFINFRQQAGYKEILTALPPGVLTVGDSDDLNTAGGMIRLTTRENKIKVVINQAALKSADLTISSKLLNVAEIFTR